MEWNGIYGIWQTKGNRRILLKSGEQPTADRCLT